MKNSGRIFVLALSALAWFADSASAADDRRWKNALSVESHDAGDASTPQFAFASNGNAVAVWLVSDGENGHVWASRYIASARIWVPVVQIDESTGSATSPQVAVDTLGNAWVVWSESSGIQARSYAVNGTRGTIRPLQAIDGSSAAPQIAFDANGNALAVWHQSDGSHTHVWSSRLASGNTQWDTAVPVEANGGDAVFPQIAVGGSGNAIVVWQQSTTGSHTDIWANRFVVGQGWSTVAARAIEDNAGNAFAPQVALDASGNARAIWFEFDTDPVARNRVWSSRYAVSNDHWSAATPVEANSGGVTNPRVALDPNGNAVAVWSQAGTRTDNTPVRNVWSSRSAAGSDTWDAAALIEHDDTGDALSPSIAMDASGNALAVWHQLQPPPTGPNPPPPVLGVWAARYTPAVTLTDSWAPAELIEQQDDGDAVLPRVLFDTTGSALALWSQFDGRPNVQHVTIRANRYAKPDLIGRFAYIPNGPMLGVHRIDAASGQLTLLSSYNPGAGTVYESVAIEPRGQMAYVLEALAVEYFRIDAATGALSRQGGVGAPVTPFDVIVEPLGRFLYVYSAAGVTPYVINQTTGMPLQTSGGIDVSFPGRPEIDPTGRLLYLPVTNAIAVYAINATTGKLTDTGLRRSISGSSVSLRISPSGKFAYVSNSDANTVTAFAIDAVTGNLIPVGSAVATGTRPYRIAIDPSERFVYIANRGSGDVSAYAIDQATGALSAVTSSRPPAGTNPDDIRVDPSGLFVYVSNFSSKDVVTFSVDPLTGALTRRSVVVTSTGNNSSPVFIRILPGAAP